MSAYLKKHDLSQVMAHTGFGEIKIYDTEGNAIYIGQKGINKKTGGIKKAVLKLLSGVMTIGIIMKLHDLYEVTFEMSASMMNEFRRREQSLRKRRKMHIDLFSLKEVA